MNSHTPLSSALAWSRYFSRYRFTIILLVPIVLGVATAIVRKSQKQNSPARAPSASVQLPPPSLERYREPHVAAVSKARSSIDLVQTLTGRSADVDSRPRFPVSEPQVQEEFEGDVRERMNWFIFQRRFPFDDIPEEARLRAWESRPADAPLFNSAEHLGENVAVVPWQQIGPMPTNSFFPSNWGKTSGRINAIAVSPANPNIILIGGATGGVWRSSDGGTTFIPVSDNQVDLAVGSIAFAPSNGSIVYAGMGDKDAPYLGTGVLRSSDGGQTWTRVSNATLPSLGRISQVLVDSSDPNRVYVAQYAFSQGNSLIAGGFYYSTDSGVNWTKTISGTAKDLVRHPTQPAILYLALNNTDPANGSNGGVFKSMNSGQSWQRVYTSFFGIPDNIKIAVTPAAPENVYVLNGKSTARVEVSTNGGSTWTNRGANFDTGQFYYNCYLFVHPLDPNTIYVGTRDLWRSTNGGSTYTNITGNFNISGNYTPNVAKSHPDQHHFYISPSNPSTIYVANDGGLWKSTDGASSFTSLNSTLSLTMFTSYDMHPTDTSRSYGGTQDNGTQKRTAAQTWQEFATGDGGQTFVDTLDPTIVYATYVFHTVFRFTNNGDNFAATIGSATTFNNDRVAFYPPFVGNETNSNLYFGTFRLYVSTNHGASWTTPGGFTDLTFGTSQSVLSAIAVAKSNTNVIYTGASDGRLMVSTNGGVNWTDRTSGLPQRFIKSITITPTDPNTAYVTVSGFGSGHVFKTINGGASWTNISGNLPDIPTNDLLIDPRPGNSNTLYAGTDIGVFRSTVGGTTWETFNNGLPPTIVSELDAQASGLMQVGTYGRGAFEINLNQTTNTTVQFSSATFSVNENAGSATITVSRAGTTSDAVSVNYSTSNGSAIAGQDYASAGGTLSFAAGETTRTFNVTILDDAAAEGNETINLALSNPTGSATLGSPSTAVLTIVDNESSCSFTLNPTNQSFGSAGGSGSFSVNTSAGCGWTAVSNASWITTTSAGSGNGTVNFTVAANNGAARTSSITVNSQTFTVNQSAGGGGCPSTAISVGQTINGTITTSDCFFTGTTRYVDVYNFSGTAGQQIAITMNSGTFDTYLYLLNSSNQVLMQDDDGGGGTNSRIPATFGFFTLPATGTYTIYATSFSFDGITGSTGPYSISLLGATNCTFSLSPTSQSFGASGGSSSFAVTTAAGCAWSAISNAGWITTNSTGSGPGTVSYFVASNTGSARTGTITVNNQTFTVNQSSGGGCPATTITAGQTINGTLTTSDCFFTGTTRYVDVYNFSGTAGQQIVINMNSNAFDTYLYLLDSANQTITQDDDGGSGTNSRVPSVSGFFTLPSTGTFTIYATSYSFDGFTGGTGAYSISLSTGSVASTIQFSAPLYAAGEASGGAVITVTRLGDVSGNATVKYVTSDTAGLQNCTVVNGRASERCDYVTALGTVSFSPGETSKTFNLAFIDDVHMEGNETFTVSLSGPGGASLGSTASATVTISENDFTVPTSNPIDGVAFFIRQQYLDILNRQPDTVGLQNWINTLAPCPNGGFGEPPTSNCDRLHVAAGFFQSDEFLNRGYWAFRCYMVSHNQRPTYAQFIPDMAQVGGPKSPAEEEASKVVFADAFVQRPEFLARYGGLSGQPLANALLQTAGLPANTFTVTGGMTNGQILRGIVETSATLNKFLTEGTVSIQYFGFLRRDPDTIGYQNNVNTLNANPSNLRHMIFIFIYSQEYRGRFGP